MPSTNVNAAGVEFVRNQLVHFPRPDRLAAMAISQWAAQQGQQVDPDLTEVVTLHYRPLGAGGYQAQVVERMSLAQAVLSNWQGESNSNLLGALFAEPWAGTFPDGPITLVDALPALGPLHYGAEYAVFNGLFRQQTPARYDSDSHIRLPAEAFRQFIDSLDFHDSYLRMLRQYWAEHLDGHATSCKISFIGACNRQIASQRLSRAASLLAWQAAGLVEASAGLQVSLLNVYGYIASDLLCIRDLNSGLTLLYIPGNPYPLHEFASHALMCDWFAEQCKDASTRDQLCEHFSYADRPDGLDFSGLATALAGLGSYPADHPLSPDRAGFTTAGKWPARTYVDYRVDHYNATLGADVFKALARHQRQRSFDDAQFLITSDAQIVKARWRGYLSSAINLLAPLAVVLPELAPLLALGGVAQFGLGINQALSGRSARETAEGLETLSYGLLNAAPLVIASAAEAAQVFRAKATGFVTPSRINEHWGYPLSPVHPPHLPDYDVGEYFHNPEPIAPLPGGNPAVADAVIRVPRYDGNPDLLEADLEGYNRPVVYDMERDAFISEEALNETTPHHYIAQPGSRKLLRVGPEHAPDNLSRQATLRALGIDLTLPVVLPAQPAQALPIARTVSCLWVGDKTLSTRLLTNLAANARQLKDSSYQMRLFISNAAPAAFDENLRLLGEHAPELSVLPLEQQPFFRAFTQSPYHAQYQAALDGNGGVASNYASACDVLRYRMLHHDGGIYMDVDDSIRPVVPGQPAEAIDRVPLLTPPDGVLLHPPMSNESMAMNGLYNSSMIGSHAGNPLLDAISEEMHARYRARPDFYDSKPSRASDPAGFYRYASELSRMTGPALLTDVLDQQRPALYTLRQVINLYTMPRINSFLYIDTEACKRLLGELLPFSRFAKVGGDHSWARS